MREREETFSALSPKRGGWKSSLSFAFTHTLARWTRGRGTQKSFFLPRVKGAHVCVSVGWAPHFRWGWEGSGWTSNCLFYKQNYNLANRERKSANDFSLNALMQKDAPWTKQQFDSSSSDDQRERGRGWLTFFGEGAYSVFISCFGHVWNAGWYELSAVYK